MPMAGRSTWVVYQSVQGKQMGAKSICELREWEALERSNPGANELLIGGLQSESQAENSPVELPATSRSEPWLVARFRRSRMCRWKRLSKNNAAGLTT